MNYLYVSPLGDLEIWKAREAYDNKGNLSLEFMLSSLSLNGIDVVSLNAWFPCDPEFWGREFIELWDES